MQTKILAALKDLDSSLPVSLDTASVTINRLFAESKIPNEIAATITEAYATLSNHQPKTQSHELVAVRSSATAEDLPEASFAGQQETFLNIRGDDALLDPVEKCWASLWTACAIAYRIKNNIDQNCVALAVVVQEMVNAEASTPPLYGFLAAISAGITEETLFRLFGRSLLAWFGGLLFHDPDGRPKPVVFWTANVLLALAFGATHLQTAAAIGWPINALAISGTMILNGLGGLAFGWFFWTFGLECAVLAHIFADVILHALMPFTATLQGERGRILAIASVVVVISLTIVWAWRTRIAESHRYHVPTAN